MINWQIELQSVGRQLLESPKTTVSMSAISTALGIANYSDLIHGIFAGLAFIVSLSATAFLARYHWIKSNNEEIRGKILRKQAEGMGIDLASITEDDE